MQARSHVFRLSLRYDMNWQDDLVKRDNLERKSSNQIKEKVREGGHVSSLLLIDLTLIHGGKYMTHQRQIHISFPLSMEVLLRSLYIHSNTHTM